MEEKVFTINLRRQLTRTSRMIKGKKAVSIVREYLRKHMKINDVKIGDSINNFIWARGLEKPPGKVKIKAIKTKGNNDVDIVKAEMWGHVFEEELKEEKKPEKQGKTEESKNEKTEEKPKKEPKKPVEQEQTEKDIKQKTKEKKSESSDK